MRLFRTILLSTLLASTAFGQVYPSIGGTGTGGVEATPSNLQASVTSNTSSTITITADCVPTDDGTTGLYLRTVNVTSSLATAGPAAGGRDQAGAFTASSWVYAYLIYGFGQATSALWSASASAPTLPSGYTHAALVSAAYMASSGNTVAYPYYVVGRQHFYTVGGAAVSAVTNGHATGSYSTVSGSAFAPPTAHLLMLAVNIQGNAVGDVLSLSSDGANQYFGQSAVSTTTGFKTFVLCVCDATQNVYYKLTSASDTANIGVFGFIW